jgi:hypothetical protein
MIVSRYDKRISGRDTNSGFSTKRWYGKADKKTKGAMSKEILVSLRSVPEAYKSAICYNFARYCNDKQEAQAESQCMGMPPYALSLLLISYV